MLVEHLSMVLTYALLPPTVFNKMYNHILTDKGLELFDADHKASLKNYSST